MSAYESHLAARWERMNDSIETSCVECGDIEDVHPSNADGWVCGPCYDRAHCEFCNGTGQIGAPWSPDSCPECPAPGKPLTNYAAF